MTANNLQTQIKEIHDCLSPLDQEIFTVTLKHLADYKQKLSSAETKEEQKQYQDDIACCNRILKLLGNRESRKQRCTLIYNISYVSAIILKAAMKAAIGI